MEHFQHIDIMQPGAFARLGLAAMAWILDHDVWVWVCGAMAFLNLMPLTARRTRSDTWRAISEFGGWSAIALAFVYYRAPAVRWLENPTFDYLPWQAELALFVVQWLVGAMLIVGAVASLFGGNGRRRERNREGS